MKRHLLFVVLFLLLFASVGMGTYNRLFASDYFKIIFYLNLVALPNSPPPVPINDLPCDAIALSIGTSSLRYNNFDATNSWIIDNNIPNPSCGNYSDSDVWFEVDVPATGDIDILVYSERNTNWLDTANFTVYTGLCGSLTEIGCYEATGPDFNWTEANFSGRSVGETLYIRVYGQGGLTGDFEIYAVGSCDDIIVDAGTASDQCGIDFDFNATGVGIWSLVDGPGIASFSSLTDPTATVTVTKYGTYTFKWTAIGNCGKSENISVKFQQPPFSDPEDDKDICGLFTTISVASASVGDVFWTKKSGPGTVVFNPVAPFLWYAPEVTVSEYGDYEFTLTVVNGTCSDTDDVKVRFYEEPSDANVGSNQNSCGTLTSESLGGNTPTIGIGTWSKVSGPGNETFENENLGTSKVTVDAIGDYVFRWTISNGPCVEKTADINVSFIPAPTTATVGADQEHCAILKSDNLDANTPIVGNGSWSQVSGPGTSTFSAITPGDTLATATQYGQYVYRWTITNLTCTSSADITVDYFETPTTATVGSNQNICGLKVSDPLGGNTPTAGTGEWSQISGPGLSTFVGLNDGNTTVNVTSYGSYVYRWTISNGTCTSTSADVTVNFHESPVAATVGTDQDICGNNIATTISAALGGNTPTLPMLGTWSQISGPGTTTFSNVNSGSSTADPDTFGSYVYRWTISNGTCTSTSADITLNFHESPVAATVGTDQDICGNNIATTISAALGGNTPTLPMLGTWSQISGPGTTTFSNVNSGSSTADPDTFGSYVYRWTISNGTCTSTSADITVNFHESPVSATVGTDQDICGNNIATTVSAALGGNTPTLPMLGTWSQISGPGTTTFSNVNSGSSTADPDAFGSYVYRWTISNGTCTSTSADITVNFHESPVAATVGTDQDICGNNIATTISAALGGNTPTLPMFGTWSQISGPGTTTFSNVNSGSSTADPDTFGSYVYRWTISNGTCTSTSADITVNFHESPVAASVGTDQDICGNNIATTISAALGGNTPTLPMLGTWSQISGPGTTTFSNVNSGSSTADPDTFGSYVYRWTISNGTCTSTSADITVNYYQNPSAASVGGNQDRCGTLTSLALGGNTPTVGAGTWSQVSGPGLSTFFSLNDGNTTVNVTSYGTYIFRWTISNGTCSDETADVTVNYYQNPTAASVGGNQDRCGTLTSLALGGNVPAIGTGTWSQVSGPGTTGFSSISLGNSTATATDYGTYVYRWTISNGNCSDETADITVNYYQSPTAASVGGNQERCGTLTSLALGGNVPAIGTGTWSQVSGPGTTGFSSISLGNSTATATDYGTYVYRWTISNGTCSDETADVTVNYYQSPSAASVGSNQDRCGTLTSLALGGNTPTVGTGSWSQVSGPGTTGFSSVSSGNSTATATDYGTYVYRWTIKNGTCSDETADVTVNYYQSPSVASVGGNQDRCGTLTSLALGGNTPTVGTGTWSQVSGPGTTGFSSVSSGNSTATATDYGTYVYRWTISNGNCSTTSADITINFNQQPIADAGSGGNECDLNFALAANPSVGTGTWTKVSGAGTLSFSTNANDPNAVVTNDTYETVVLRWTEVNGTCSDSDEVTINFYQQPNADAGSGGDECDLNFALAANPSVGTGTWTKVSGAGTLSFSTNTNDPNAVVTNDTYETVVLRWTEVNGICSDSDDVTINFYQQPNADAGSGGDECDLNFALAANPSIGTGTWTKVSGAGTLSFSTNANDPNAVVTNDTYETVVLRWTEVNGTCSDSDDITVNFFAPSAVATVGVDQERCGVKTSLPLGGNTPSEGVGTWYQESGPGLSTFSNDNDGNTIATVSNYGTYVYRWSITNGTCSASTADITVTYYENSEIATVGSNQERCGSLVSQNLGGNTPVSSIGTWTQVSGPGLSNFSDESNGNSTVTADTYGSYVYRWTFTNGPCFSSQADITVDYYELPSNSSVGSDQNICGSLNSNTLGGNTPVVGIGTWTQISGPGLTIFSSVNDGNSIASADTFGTYIYRWTISNGTCTPNTADISITFYETATISSVGADQDLCGTLTSNSLGGNTPAVGIGSWSQVSGPGISTFDDINTGDTFVTTDTYGTYVYRWTVTNGSCSSISDITIIYNDNPSLASVGADQFICGSLSSSSLDGNVPTIGLGTWTQLSGPGTTVFSSINNGNSTANADSYGVYVYRWTISNGSCTANSADITVEYKEDPTTATVGVDQNYCALLTSNSLTGNTPTVGTGSWSQLTGPGTSVFSSINNGNSTATADTYGTYVYRWSISNSTCISTADITVNYNEVPSSYAGLDDKICGPSYQIAGSTSANGTILWTTSGDGSFSDNTIDNPIYNRGPSDNGIITLTKTVSNASCPAASDSMVLNVSLGPDANAGNGGDACDLDFDLSAIPSVGIGTWTKVSGAGNVTFLPNENSPNAIATVDIYGNYELMWSETNDGCTDSKTITVNYYQQPNADAGIGGDECDLDYQLTAISSIGTGSWTKVSGPGNLVFSPNNNDPQAIVTADVFGSYKLAWTEVNGACSDMDEIIVNFYQQPVANAGLGGSECDLNFNLNATPSVGIGEWTQVGGVGLITYTPNNNDPNAIVSVDRYGSYQFEWKETNGVCTDSEIISVDFYVQPNTNAGSGGDVCGLTYDLSATASSGIGNWVISAGNGNATYVPNSNDPNAQVVVDTYGSYTFTWTENNGVCSDSDNVDVNFYEQPNSIAGLDGESCGLNYELNASTSAGTGVWNKLSGIGNVSFSPNANDPNAIVTVDEYGTYQFTWTETNGICVDTDQISVEFAEQPIANAGIDLNLEYAENISLSAQLSTGGTGEWRITKGSASFYDTFSPTTIVQDLSVGENILEWTETNQYCVDSDEIKIAVSNLFIPTVITPNGDQNNEFFKIRGLENLENVHLTILDRRGIEVFTNNNYQNDWNGKDRNGTDLVVDTYFYVLKLDDGRVLKGYIVIKR